MLAEVFFTLIIIGIKYSILIVDKKFLKATKYPIVYLDIKRR